MTSMLRFCTSHILRTITSSILVSLLLVSIASSTGTAFAETTNVEIVLGASGKTTDAYLPNPIIITKGDTVKWINKDTQSHTVTSGKSPSDIRSGVEFDSGLDDILFKDDTFIHRFDTIGEFPYYCELHPGMVGTIMVSETSNSDTNEEIGQGGDGDTSEDGSLGTGEENDVKGVNNYLFGCTQYVPFNQCHPIVNEFESLTVASTFSKVLSVTREATFVDSRNVKGVWVDSHSLESIRINNLPQYQSNEFTFMISINPGADEAGNRYSNIVTFRNGIFVSDWHNAGWELSFQPNSDPSLRSVRFTVFKADGGSVSPMEALIPIEKFSDIAGSFDGRSVKLYVDGQLHSQANFNGKYNPNPQQDIKIAGDAYCSCYLTRGVFDDFRLYNGALTDGQILLGNYNSDLVGHWKFDGNLNDATIHKNDAFYNTMLGHMAFSNDGRLFYTEKNSGNIRIVQDDRLRAIPFANIPDIHVNWEQGLLGLTLDSKFDENHFVYVYHNYQDVSSGQIFARVVRFTDDNNVGKDMTVILDRIPASTIGFHTGGALAFNTIDDMLYVTVGDSYNKESAQVTDSLNGKVLRISRDGEIPPDNPFGSAVYTYGHRNMYGIGFDPQGHGIISEASENLYDEINYVSKGGNYGWPNSQPADVAPELSNGTIKPLRSYFQTLNPTQIVYYDSDKHPQLKDSFLVGAFRGYIYSYKIDESGQRLINELKIDTNKYPSSEVVGVAVSPKGEIYFGSYDIYKLQSIDLSGATQTMFPVQVNSSKLNVQSVIFDKDAGRLRLQLQDEQGFSRISIKIMNSMIGILGADLGHESTTAIATDGKTSVSLPYRVVSQPTTDSNIVSFEFSQDYSNTDDLELILTGSQLSVTKTIPEFGLPLVLLTILLVAVISFSRVKGFWTSATRRN